MEHVSLLLNRSAHKMINGPRPNNFTVLYSYFVFIFVKQQKGVPCTERDGEDGSDTHPDRRDPIKWTQVMIKIVCTYQALFKKSLEGVPDNSIPVTLLELKSFYDVSQASPSYQVLLFYPKSELY